VIPQALQELGTLLINRTKVQCTKKMEIWWLARMNALIGFVGVLKKETDS
jgi:hypothetical protein